MTVDPSSTAVRAAVSDGAGRTEVVVREAGPAAGWLRVESSAVCGTDVALHEGGLRHPAVLGHHVVGTVEQLTDRLAADLGVSAGQRVAIEEYLGCGTCTECLAGRYRLCPDVDLWGAGQRVGMLPADERSGLHGGNAEILELEPRHRCHVIPASVPFALAAWTLPLANAIDWTVRVPRATAGESVAVVGPGYHGLACVAAARAHGLTDVTVVGLPADRGRLALAADMGARTHEVEEGHGLPESLQGRFDVVVDTVGATATVASAVEALRRSGRLVLAGLSGQSLGLDSTALVRGLLTVRGVRGRAPGSVRDAVQVLIDGGHGLDAVPTHRVALEDVGPVLASMRRREGPETPHVVVTPTTGPTSRTPNRQEALR